jgi:hypothetical protein
MRMRMRMRMRLLCISSILLQEGGASIPPNRLTYILHV